MYKYRAVMYSSHNGVNLTTYSEPFHYENNADDFLYLMRELDKCTGGHVEQLIQIDKRGPEWVLR